MFHISFLAKFEHVMLGESRVLDLGGNDHDSGMKVFKVE